MRVNKGIMSGGAFAWLFQRISGAVLAILMIIHFMLIHYVTAKGAAVSYNDVAQRLSSPAIRFIELIFLFLLIYHGFNGVWMMVQDYVHHNLLRALIFSVIMIFGLALFFIGANTLIAFQPVI
ncbi:MAG: succinate dehydrogenase, hydrophobic membrane anchor protein [Deltaproteobacteria bacterium]|nr:succinate dehydrogenase, hydrophobic membrane anchor protein [Deltaproteobacteria bacterium]